MFSFRFFIYISTSLHPESWPFWFKTGGPSATCKLAVFCYSGSVSPTRPQMRSSPLQFLFSDIFYFMFYTVSPNLGHFGPKPVGLLPCASMQFSALVHPVQPTHPVPSFQRSFLFYMDVLQPLAPMATLTTCATFWPVPMLSKLHGNTAGPAPSRHAHPAAQPPADFLASTPLRPPVRCSPLLSFFYFLLSRLLSTSSSSSSASCSSTVFRLFGLRGSVEI